MPNSLSDLERLRHFEEALKDILDFSNNKTVDDLFSNRMFAYAARCGFEIMGEASGKVSDGLKNIYPEIPWRDMEGNAKQDNSWLPRY